MKLTRVRRRLVAIVAATAAVLGVMVVGAQVASANSLDGGNTYLLFEPGSTAAVNSPVTVEVVARDSGSNGGSAVTGHLLTLQPNRSANVEALDTDLQPTCGDISQCNANPTHTNLGAGVTDGSGSAYFAVTPNVTGTLCFTVIDQSDSNHAVAPTRCLTVTGDGAGVVNHSTVTKSLGRVTADGYASATIVVQAKDASGNPVPSQYVWLDTTTHNPTPPVVNTPRPYGKGFFDETFHPSISPSNVLQTDSSGVAVFTVTDTNANDLAYFTPMFFLGGSYYSAGNVSTAVLFGDPPNNEATDSKVQLDNPVDDSNGPTSVVAPADGTTAVAVYVQLHCDCDPASGPTTNFQHTYKDGPYGHGGWIRMPAPTQSGNGSDLVGALTELLPSSGSTHAVITPAYDATQNDQSNDPLSAGQAYTGPLDQDPTSDTGVAVFTVTDTVAEDVTLQGFDATNNVFASYNPNSSSGPPTPENITIHFQPTSPYRAHSTVTASPSQGVPADGTTTSTITVTVRDIQNNPISGRTIVLSANSQTAGIQQSSVTTGTDGTAQFKVTDTKAQTVTFTADDQQTGLIGSTNVTFVAAPPSILNSSIGVNPTTVPADGTSATTITVSLEDGKGNPATGLPVAITQGGGSSIITPVPTQPKNGSGQAITDSNGLATFTATDSTVETVYYQATVPGSSPPFVLAALTPVSFIAGAVSGGNSSVTADLTSVPADGTSASTVTVTLRDGNRNPVSGKSVTLASTGSAVITPSGPQTTGKDGTAKFTVTDATPETVTVSATDTSDNISVGTPLSLVFTGPPSVANSSVTATPTSAPVNSIVTLKVITRDANNQPVSGQHIFLNSIGSAYILSTSPSSGVTGSDGTVTYLVSSSSPGVVAYTAIDQTTSTQVGVENVTYFGAPVGVHSTIAVNPDHVPADGASSATVTVTLHDINDVPVSGYLVSLSGNSAHTTITPNTPEQTDANGVATFAVSDSFVEKVTYTATAGQLTTNPVTVTFTQPQTEAGNSSVIANPTSGVPADGTTASGVTVMLVAANGTPIGGHVVSLSCPGGSASPLNVTSLATGEADFGVTSTSPGTVTCTATDTTAGVTLDETAQIGFVVPPTEANQSTVTAAPSAVPSDGSTSTVTVTLRDKLGNPISGHSVTLGQGGGHSTISPPSATTNGSGVATFQVSDTTAELVTYTATDSTAGVTIQQTAGVTFSDEKAASTATATPTSVPADGSSKSSIIVTLTAAGQPVVGHHVTLTALNGASSITISTDPTGQDGKAVFQVTDTVAEVVKYSVTDDALGLTIDAQPQVTFTNAVPAPVVTGMTPDFGAAGTTVTITGQNLQGAAVTFGATPAGTVAINLAGTQVTATAPGGTGAVTVKVATGGGTATAGQFTYGTPAPFVSSMSATYGTAGTAVTITGTGLANAAVIFGGVAATIVSDTGTQIVTSAPSGPSGLVQVVVSTANGTGGAGRFAYTGGSTAPAITLVTPTSGASGNQVTITGSRLTGTTVLFGAMSAVKVSNTATKIVAQVPGGNGSAPIVLATSGGATFAGTFAFTSATPAAAITGMSPGTGHTGIQVTITGANLDGAQVDFGGEPAVTVSNVGTTLVVKVPSGDGPANVTVETGGGRVSAGTFTVLPTAPKITSFTPHTGSAGTKVTLVGTNLNGATSVKFGTASAVIVSDSTTRLVVTVPAGTGSMKIVVHTAIGTGSTPTKFTYQ